MLRVFVFIGCLLTINCCGPQEEQEGRSLDVAAGEVNSVDEVENDVENLPPECFECKCPRILAYEVSTFYNSNVTSQ